MQDEQAVSAKQEPTPRDMDGAGFLEIFQVIAENLRILVMGPLAVAVIAACVSLLLPPTYTATATFLPPQQQQGMASGLLASLGAIGGLAGAASGLKNPTDQYVSFLKTNSVADELISRFGLMERYGVHLKSDARKALEKNTRITSGKDNIVSVEFDDRDAAFSASVANAYGEELTKLLSRLAITEAQQRRVFFGKQLTSTKDALVEAEKALAATGVSVSALNSNPVTALEGPARLRAQVTAQEVRLASMRSYLTDAAPEFRQAQAELVALRKQLSQVENIQPGMASGNNDYIAKFRDFKYQETLFDLFSRQYEVARVDESREGAVVQVVDIAQIPERKSKPRKFLITAIAAAVAAVLLFVIVFLRHAWLNIALDKRSAERIVMLKTAFRRSFGRR